MNFNIKIFLLCPIPDEQKPINEYINLKEKDFTNFLLLNLKNYFFKVFSYFFLFFCLGFIVYYLFQLKSKIILFNLSFSLFILFFMFLTNFLSWSQLLKRIRSSRIFYVEGSWFDGQFW